MNDTFVRSENPIKPEINNINSISFGLGDDYDNRCRNRVSELDKEAKQLEKEAKFKEAKQKGRKLPLLFEKGENNKVGTIAVFDDDDGSLISLRELNSNGVTSYEYLNRKPKQVLKGVRYLDDTVLVDEAWSFDDNKNGTYAIKQFRLDNGTVISNKLIRYVGGKIGAYSENCIEEKDEDGNKGNVYEDNFIAFYSNVDELSCYRTDTKPNGKYGVPECDRNLFKEEVTFIDGNPFWYFINTDLPGYEEEDLVPREMWQIKDDEYELKYFQ